MNPATLATNIEVSMPTTSEGREVLARFFRATGDQNRLQLLDFLAGGEHSATECVQLVGLAQSRVSSHLACLVSCGLVSVRRQGRFAFYKVVDPRVMELIRLGTEIAADNAESVAKCIKVAEFPIKS